MTYHEIVVYPNGMRTEKVAKVYESHQHVDILPNGSTTLDQLQRLRDLLEEAEKALTNTLSLAENVGACRSAPVRLACVEGRIEASVCCTPPFHSLNR